MGEIRDLTVSVGSDRMGELEGVARILNQANASLRRLEIRLVSDNKERPTRERGRGMASYMSLTNMLAGVKLSSSSSRREEILELGGETEESLAIKTAVAVKEAENCEAELGKMWGLRHLVVYGMPEKVCSSLPQSKITFSCLLD